MSEVYPLVEMAVVLITDGERRYVVDWNAPWGNFMFPATKLHDLPGATPKAPPDRETPLAAACRAAAEVLGRPLVPNTLVRLPNQIPPWNQSGRDGQWKRYTVHLFQLTYHGDPCPLPGHTALWLTRSELLALEPISPTLRSILAVLPA